MKQQKSKLNRTRTLIRREDGSTEVEENGIRVAGEPDNVASTYSCTSVIEGIIIDV